ncbi:hypothetical protein GCM10017783_10370 [Deinococcus piscis]|uniref:Uncharacterized protein n=1 Tax=Deinococcus piscis TaxID=394230 RepID=A0ABQ3K2C1_9DEIO|nr:hypothetical protein [Deinococcus piscis]GHG00181.1 hypothetical protein GCM10017783_10370 [Deinococcus piscis]
MNADPAQDAGRITFPSLPAVPVPRSCSLDPALYALDWVLNWAADVNVAGQPHAAVPVFPLLRRIRHDPATYGVSPAEAQAAAERFMAEATAALEAEGGRREWLEREFGV